MRKIVVIVLVFMSSHALAHVLRLSPKESKSITNYSLSTLKANCNIQGSQKGGKILFSVLENKASVNGKSISKGHATSVAIKNNTSLSVSAEKGATVNLVNLGDEAVEAVCFT